MYVYINIHDIHYDISIIPEIMKMVKFAFVHNTTHRGKTFYFKVFIQIKGNYFIEWISLKILKSLV